MTLPGQSAALTEVATDSIIKARAEVAQVVEHGTENAGVDSSSLSLGTTSFPVDVFRFAPVPFTSLRFDLRRFC